MNQETISIKTIARICHETNVALCKELGEETQGHWEECPEWQRESSIEGVKFSLDNPDAPPSSQHDAWMETKIRDGWVYGSEKDPVKKTHPCLVSFWELPATQRIKDHLFQAICKAFVDGGFHVI